MNVATEWEGTMAWAIVQGTGNVYQCIGYGSSLAKALDSAELLEEFLEEDDVFCAIPCKRAELRRMQKGEEPLSVLSVALNRGPGRQINWQKLLRNYRA